MTKDRDPGDAVPPGVAPAQPVPPTREDEQARENLERLGRDAPSTTSPRDRRGLNTDCGVEAASQSVEPDSDAPTRAGISGSGSGADNQGL